MQDLFSRSIFEETHEMEAKPTYHLPPNFSTPPPPNGPFHLGTVLRDFETKEEMRPLNQKEAHRIAISEKFIDHKGGFEATREKLKSGEFGLWAKFIGLEGIGGEAGISVETSDSDRYLLLVLSILSYHSNYTLFHK